MVPEVVVGRRPPEVRLEAALDELLIAVDEGRQQSRLAIEAEKVAGLGKRLVALSPFEVLARGYAVDTRSADGSLIRSVGQVKENEQIEVRVSDGKFDAIVNRK